MNGIGGFDHGGRSIAHIHPNKFAVGPPCSGDRSMMTLPANCKFITQRSTCDHLHTRPASGRFAAAFRALCRCSGRSSGASTMSLRTVRCTSCSIKAFEFSVYKHTACGPCVRICVWTPAIYHVSGRTVCDRSACTHMHCRLCGATRLGNAAACVKCSQLMIAVSSTGLWVCVNEL